MKASGLAHLVNGSWQKLETLNLSRNRLSGEDWRPLSQAAWPSLVSLDISYNPVQGCGLEASERLATYLVRGRFSLLKELIMDQTGMGKEALFQLSQGWWPQLLSLGRNRLDNGAIPFLVEGNWPLLH